MLPGSSLAVARNFYNTSKTPQERSLALSLFRRKNKGLSTLYGDPARKLAVASMQNARDLTATIHSMTGGRSPSANTIASALTRSRGAINNVINRLSRQDPNMQQRSFSAVADTISKAMQASGANPRSASAVGQILTAQGGDLVANSRAVQARIKAYELDNKAKSRRVGNIPQSMREAIIERLLSL